MKWERGLLALRTPIPSLLQSAACAMGQFISLRNDMTFSDILNNTTNNISKSFTLALFRYSFPKFQSLLTTTSSTATRLCPYVQSIPKNSGCLQHNYNDSVTS